jgi:lysophospholipase L1-like esterase
MRGTRVTSRRADRLRRATCAAIVAAGAALVGLAVAAEPHWVERHVLASYCATGPAGWVLVRGFRSGLAAGGIVAAFLAPALARRTAALLRGARAATAAAVALAVAASLGVTELYLRSVQSRLAFGEALPPREGAGAAMTRPDPRLGWSYFPSRTTWTEVGGRRVAYRTDAEGNRCPAAGAPPPGDRPAILFAGESIAFGYGLEWEETFASLVGRDLGVEPVNLAVVGYGNDQAYLKVEDALARRPPPLAVVTVFIPDQIRRNVDRWRPRLALGADGALAPAPPSGGLRLAKLLQALPYHGDEGLRVTAAVLRATADAARAHGAVPLFVVTNYGGRCRCEPGREAWIVEELFVRQGLPFVRVDLEPADRLPGLLERHPNARGARRIADAIERALSERLGPRLVGARGR